MYKISSRRYIGSKTKLLNNISQFVAPNKVFVDLFGGTGVVSNHFAHTNKIIVNDLLFSNYLIYDAFFGDELVSESELKEKISQLNSLDSYDNYFSENYGNLYFDKKVAMKIGVIREWIEHNCKQPMKNILIASLMYSMDRYANTVGHYEMYLKNTKKLKDNFELKLIDLSKRGLKIEYHNKDANELIKQITGDILYLDPPYNARQYINFYHVWENLAKWDKPELKWESKKFDRTGLKSKYSTAKATETMIELLSDAKKNFKRIIVSYNNTYNANSIASNNKISYENMVKMLENIGELNIFEAEHKFFNSGKTNFQNHVEYIFVVDIK